VPTGRAVAAALVAPALFGTIGTARVLGPDLSSWTVTWGRCVVATVVLGGLLAARGALPAVARAGRSRPVLVAACCQATFQVCFLTAVLRTGVATATLATIGSVPLFAGLVSRRVTRTWTVATALAVAGVSLLVTAGSTVTADSVGVALAVAAGASYAVYLVALERMAGEVHPVAVVGATFGLVALLMIPGTLLAGDAAGLLTPEGLALVLWLGVAATAVAYVLISWSLSVLPPATVSTLALAEPPVAALLAVTLLGESFTVLGVVGGLLVGAGVLLLARTAVREPSPQPAREPEGTAPGGVAGRLAEGPT
jgi:DME family drug/metabolite transporter